MATRKTKDELLRQIAYLEGVEISQQQEINGLKRKIAEIERERDDWREAYNCELQDHKLTLMNLNEQARIAGVLAVGGRTSNLPGKADVPAPRRTYAMADQTPKRG